MNSLQIGSHKNQTGKNGVLVLTGPDDGVSWWLTQYLTHEVTTADSSKRAQHKDIVHFFCFMMREEGTDDRPRWTPRLSRAFQDHLRSLINDKTGGREYADSSISRKMAHLKTFAKWIHKLRPFPLGDPMEKVTTTKTGNGLEIERALTKSERRRLLDAGDLLPGAGGRSKDRNRYRGQERPQRKGYRGYRNRAIIYTFIETGMRRAGVCNILLDDIDWKKQTIKTTEKGGNQHTYHISREGLAVIQDYIDNERGLDNIKRQSAGLFLTAAHNGRDQGSLSTSMINRIWNAACKAAGVEGRTPHSARHAMGRHIVEKTGNVAAVQRQLGHKNAGYSMQYMRVTGDEMRAVLEDRK